MDSIINLRMDEAKGRGEKPMSRKSERRKTAAARQATTQPAAEPAQWRTTQETLIMAQISRTALHRKTKTGTFPRPIKIGKKCVWIEDEIKQWMKR